MSTSQNEFSPTERSRVRLMRQRGSYDRRVVYDILDSALMCNVGYVIDGQPYVTPTAFWREHNHLYWHGSSASRALNAQIKDIPVCVTVAHIDGLVMARSGFHSSVNYRAVMAFGKAQLVEGLAAKRAAMNVYMDRFCPDRAATNRTVTDKELNVTKVLVMEIDEASAKVRTGQPVDDDEDYELPIWAGVIDFKTVVDQIRPDPRNLQGVPTPAGIEAYTPGATLDSVLSSIYDGDKPPR
ncbi:pyridoxamine 5'-phosphate oxidase family protein [Verticiella sediminum]|uniref:pyridoxamine 5'-phosphate oxidase family protein n=1 Tax=Verticiella sediminum TaxID=1247510 RepID=UPI001B884742|nr:pyridoxamine 5'-phosphate oxidase family protein [Verticiella sediminum]